MRHITLKVKSKLSTASASFSSPPPLHLLFPLNFFLPTYFSSPPLFLILILLPSSLSLESYSFISILLFFSSPNLSSSRLHNLVLSSFCSTPPLSPLFFQLTPLTGSYPLSLYVLHYSSFSPSCFPLSLFLYLTLLPSTSPQLSPLPLTIHLILSFATPPPSYIPLLLQVPSSSNLLTLNFVHFLSFSPSLFSPLFIAPQTPPLLFLLLPSISPQLNMCLRICHGLCHRLSLTQSTSSTRCGAGSLWRMDQGLKNGVSYHSHGVIFGSQGCRMLFLWLVCG